MYIDYDADTYPFHGMFYRSGIDTDKPLLEQEEEKIVVLDTRCDITEGGTSKNESFISASFSIYFPFDEDKEFSVKRGDMFEGNMFGMEVNGKVLGVFPSDLGGAVAYLDDKDV